MFDSLLYSTAYAVSKADELWGSSRSFHTNYSEGGFTPESLEHAFDTEDLMGIDLSSADAEDELTDRIGVVDEFALADVDTNIYVFFMETLGWILSFVGLVATVMVIKEWATIIASRWDTSESRQKIFRYILGLVIIIISYSFTEFMIDYLQPDSPVYVGEI